MNLINSTNIEKPFQKQTLNIKYLKWQLQQSGGYSLPQQTQEPPAKKLAIENITKPDKLQSLPENNIGEFTTFSFEIPNTDNNEIFAASSQKSEKIRAADHINNLIEQYVHNSNPLDMIGLTDLETTTVEVDSGNAINVKTAKHCGKDVSMAKKIYQEEIKKDEEKQNNNKRKRTETVAPRLSGRPTTKETLIKLDNKVDDLDALQLHEAELVLASTSDDGVARKTKTILTKCKGNITVNTQKQYLTYKLFADLRKKALDTIKEQRDILYKINAAEITMYNLMKKSLNEKSM